MDEHCEIRYAAAYRAQPTTRLYLRHRATERPIAGYQSPVHARNLTKARIVARQRQHTRVASAYFRSWYCFVPSGMSFLGLKVRVFPLKSG